MKVWEYIAGRISGGDSMEAVAEWMHRNGYDPCKLNIQYNILPSMDGLCNANKVNCVLCLYKFLDMEVPE